AMAIAWLAPFVGAVATLPLIFCFIGNRSHGAVDNATGVATVLLALELIRDREKVGVIITSGEELGLAGAHAFASQMPLKAIALNCDTIDDRGRFISMASGKMPANLSQALDRAANRTGLEIAKHRMLLGILADNIAFTSAGWSSLTLSRGNLGTLARVHTSRDRAETIDGTGIAMAAQLLAATAEELF
ncbi:MAG: M28 family peptidase, partial [Gemmatimonadales bacterium]